MRYERNIAADARIVSPGELAQIVDAAAPVLPEHSDFELPAWMWGTMLGGYAVFFAGLISATAGEGKAAFAIVISIFYTAMFFGTARILANLDGRRVGAFTRGGGDLKTWTGPMSMGSVAGQILAIPLLLGFFGIAIAIITAIVR
ncbi:hypothetical protein GCM10011515_04170 [Tsuneonella deserti]|uniref:RDD family protein n=1 Tax=Tsuneonella deserti TaxID=2035528 RepID=A0ABQ1S1Y2_9SPHN|nr:hypothetical protein [Tsuneonella deserti]GGD87719.1 hypothetical protein GCM10011515_04170 [Tsuneonella deserti]